MQTYRLFNASFFYIVMPALVQFFVLHFFFDLPFHVFCFSVYLLATVLFFWIFIGFLSSSWYWDFRFIINNVSCQGKSLVVVYLFMGLVILFGPLDLIVNGFKLTDPNSYAELPGAGRYIRHVTILSWVLIPLSFFCIRHSVVRRIVLIYAVCFPFFILDRNRVLLTFYAFAICFLSAGYRIRFWKTLFVLILFCVLFSLFGALRSGSETFVVESSANDLVEGFYPLRDLFSYVPEILNQVVFYIATPLLNLSMVMDYGFINPEFLISQISPFSRDSFDSYPYAPILVPRFNVGSEFYPWVLYFGNWVLFPLCGFMVFVAYLSYFLLKKFPNPFSMIVFIKMTYSLIVMGFAPQFYMLFNFMFVILIFCLWLSSSVFDWTFSQRSG